MGIILIFFVVCTIVLVADHNSNQSPSLQLYIPFYISGIVLTCLLAFFEVVHPYYVAGMMLMPIPNIVTSSIILNLWDTLVKVSSSSSSAATPSITPNPVTKVSAPDTPLIQIGVLLEKANEWKKISTSLKREYQRLRIVGFQTDDYAQSQQSQQENYIKDIKSLQAQVRHCHTIQTQYEAELAQLIQVSSMHYPEFDQITHIFHHTLYTFKSLKQNLSDWLHLVQQKKNKLDKTGQWNAYQQKTAAFTKQKQQVINTQKAYRQAKDQLQVLTQDLGKAHGLNTPQSIDVNSLAHYLQLQKNTATLDKLRDLQAQAKHLKQRLTHEKQLLQQQDTQVSEQWLAYQKSHHGGTPTMDLSIWTSYNVHQEEAFWSRYEHAVMQMKRLRIATIQKAG